MLAAIAAIEALSCTDNLAHTQTRLREKTFIHPEDFFKQLHLVFLNAMHCESALCDQADG